MKVEIYNEKMKNQLNKNLKIKIIVLGIACFVWLFVKTEDNYKHNLDVPLRITNLESNQIIENEIPKSVTVTAWGKGKALFSLLIRRDASYVMDVSNVHNTAKLALDKQYIRLLRQSDIEFLNIVKPESIEVTIAELVDKKVPVIPDIEIETIPGYSTVDNFIIEPESVVVRGPQAAIDSITAIHSEKKLYKKIQRDFNKRANLVVPHHKHVKLLTKEIDIFIDVQKLMEKPIYEIPVEVRNHPKNAKVIAIPTTLSLVLEGGAELLLTVTQNDVKAYIDYQKIKESKEKYHLAYIETPEGVGYRDVKPKRFKIVVEKIHQK